MFKGSIPALITPFSGGKVDFDVFERLIERQISNGASAVVPCGTTGKSATLTHEEHRNLLEACVATVRGRVPIIAGCGSNATAEAIELVAFAKTVGADAALCVCPYYNRPGQDGLFAHFSAIADAVELPVFLYNVPSRTSSDILPETVARLSRHPNVIGLKDATGDLARVTRHISECEDRFILLSGDDPSALGFVAMGGTGCISVTANIAPAQVAKMIEAAAAGRLDEAREIERALYKLHSALFAAPSPGPAKLALSMLGHCEPDIRLPLLVPDPEVGRKLEEAMRLAGVRNGHGRT